MLALFAILAALSPAAQPHATLSAPPASLFVARPWTASLVVRPAPKTRPVVLARSGSIGPLDFAARRVRAGRYRVRMIFPRAGKWRLTARVGTSTVRLRTVTVRPQPPAVSPLPGATAFHVCGGGRAPYPQYALALGFGSAWIACGSQGEVRRYDLQSGKLTATVALSGVPAWSITAGAGAVWTVALGGNVVYRIDPATNRVSAQISVDAAVPYLWAGAGAVWAVDDAGHALIRIDTSTNRVVTRVPTGDGPAGFATDGTSAWVLNHRENSLDEINPATNGVTRLANGLAPANTAAVERIALFAHSLWVTGRGVDLLRLSPTTGEVLGRTDVGPAGIGVASDGSNLWIAAYTPAAEPRGDPIASAVARIDSDGGIATRVAPTRRLFVDGLAAENGRLWLLDSVSGLLLRLPA
ncbi:MAG TPA: hypothetical protein VGJ58_01550 [Gaiellaceae bacterium]|jgi:DNA-binding beta-propeller fold protein YncE